MALCRQWFIYGKINKEAPKDYDATNKNQPMYDLNGKYGEPILGGISNGYDEQQLINFWKDLEGYSSYLFNLSHSSDYSVITLCTMYLKCYYTSKFFAALLSMQDKQEKIDKYIRVARDMNIQVKTPDINISEEDFIEKNNVVYYGLGTVKGVGASSIPALLENRPYTGIDDALERIPKKFLNKRVGEALIKTGAFEEINDNRYELLNQFHSIRKDKIDELDITLYNKDVCIGFEKELLGTPVTFLPFWDTVKEKTELILEANITNIREKVDKRGRLMAFLTVVKDDCEISTVVFSSVYAKNASRFVVGNTVKLKGKKDDKGGFIVSKLCA